MKDMEDIIELIDEDYGTVTEKKKPRQIKTRRVSFGRIANAWTKFRISRNKKKLEKEKEKALKASYKTDSDFRLLSKEEKKIAKRAEAIAKLEAKIKVLSKEDVPTNYVQDRAIKLKDNMIKNLRANSSYAYSIGLDKEDVIFNEDAMESQDNIFDVPVEDMFNDEERDLNESVSEIIKEEQSHVAEGVREAMREQEEAKAMEAQEQAPISFDEEENVEQQNEEIEVVPTTEAAQEIHESVEDGFEEAQKSENQELSKEEIDAAINSMINALDNTGVDTVKYDDIAATIDDAMNNVDAQVEQPLNVISPEEVESVVGRTAAEEDETINLDDIESELDEAMESIRVSRNGNAARIDRFDANGEFIANPEEQEAQYNNEEEYVKYEYKPMTDEEIAQARENIEYEKYENIYKNNARYDKKIPSVSFTDVFKPIQNTENVIELPHVNIGEEVSNYDESNDVERELPMVVPEREVPALYYGNAYDTVAEDTYEDQELHFDYSDTTAKDIDSVIGKITSLNDFEELKRRAIALQQQQEYTRRQVEAAEREAEEAERQAEEAKKIAEESAKAYQAKMEKLRIYTEALEEDCNFNVNRAKLAENNTQCNRRFVETQISKVNENEALMSEIDSIIAPEAINIRRR